VPIDQREIALIFDFDGTLAEDSTAAFARWKGLKNPQADVYDVAARMVATGWDPPLAYLTSLQRGLKKRRLSRITKNELVTFGGTFKPFRGVDKFLRDLRRRFESEQKYRDAGLQLSYYIISAGIGDLIRSASIARLFREIWACEFEYDDHGRAASIKAIVTFTEKTKYLFYINKGISGAQSRVTPYAVNADLALEDRPVPLAHMVYVGDGPSDVPCMSIIQKAKPPGKTIVVVGESDIHRSWELLGRGNPVPPAYGKRGRAAKIIEDAVLTIASRVADERLADRKAKLGKKVGY
jgi:hypothetical protein